MFVLDILDGDGTWNIGVVTEWDEIVEFTEFIRAPASASAACLLVEAPLVHVNDIIDLDVLK